MYIKNIFLLIISFYLISCSVENIPYFKNDNTKKGFIKLDSPYTHKWNKKTHPFTGAAVIDTNSNGIEEIFIGGGLNQEDGLFELKNNKLINIISGTGLSSLDATFGVTAIDLNNDNFTDLIISRNTGVYIYINNNGKFKKQKININLDKNAVPFSVAVSDIDKDGDFDLYISTFISFKHFKSAIYNDNEHAKKNIMLLNTGNLNFIDITKKTGLSSKQNTFFSTFVDLDNDNYQDLILSQNTGEVEIFKNMGDTNFQPINISSGYGFWMGIGIGDYDNDNDSDILFTNSGTSIPKFLTKGDLNNKQKQNLSWSFMTNNNNMNFSDNTKKYNLEKLGFAWGSVFSDLNLDGLLDISIAQNYIKWPIHKIFPLSQKTLLQNRIENVIKFYHSSNLGLETKEFGQSPLIADLNNDGKNDFIWVNMDGDLIPYLNISKNNFVSINVPDNIKYHGSKIRIFAKNNLILYKEIIGLEGFLTDQTNRINIGITSDIDKVNVEIQFSSGDKIMYKDLNINTIHNLPL